MLGRNYSSAAPYRSDSVMHFRFGGVHTHDLRVPNSPTGQVLVEAGLDWPVLVDADD